MCISEVIDISPYLSRTSQSLSMVVLCNSWSVSLHGFGISALALEPGSWRTGHHVEGDEREEG